MDKIIEIRLPGITKLDQFELEKRLPKDDLRFEPKSAARDQYGELTMGTAIVVVSLEALRILADFLIKKYRKEVEMQMEIVAVDGTKRVITVKYTEVSSEMPKEQVLRQLADICQVKLTS